MKRIFFVLISFFLVGFTYQYPVKVTRVIDGDTFICDIDLGLDLILKNQKIRLLGCDAYEKNTDKGKVAKYFSTKFLSGNGIMISTDGARDSFGRILADVSKNGVLLKDVLTSNSLTTGRFKTTSLKGETEMSKEKKAAKIKVVKEKKDNVYGFCPVCGAPGETRERRANGNDTCENGHTYPSKDAIMEKPTDKGKFIKPVSDIKKVHVGVVLDRSSSMSSISGEIVDSFNEQLKKLVEKSKEIDTNISLVTFSTVVDPIVIFEQPVESVVDLNNDNYSPNGMTALADAVGLLLSKFEELDDASDPTSSFLIFIFTDGEENNSKKYSIENICSKKTELELTKRWVITYVGSNDHDFISASKRYGVQIGNRMSFEKSSKGVRGATSTINRSLDTYYAKAMCFNSSADNDLSKDFFVAPQDPDIIDPQDQDVDKP